MKTAVNTTFIVHPTVREPFMQWLRDEFLRHVETCGIASLSAMHRVRHANEDGSENIAVQLQPLDGVDPQKLQDWYESRGAMMLRRLQRAHGEKLLYFTTWLDPLEP